MDFAAGNLVINPQKPEWGLGKVLHVTGKRITVIFRDIVDDQARLKDFVTGKHALVLADEQSDPVLDSVGWNVNKGEPTGLRKKGGGGVGRTAGSKTIWSHPQAVDRFLGRFKGGFNDPEQINAERAYKWEAHEYYESALGKGVGRSLTEAGNILEVATRLGNVQEKTNLLSTFEKFALRGGLKDEAAARPFLNAFWTLVDAPGLDEGAFLSLAHAVNSFPAPKKKTDPYKWTIVTVLPFLARPDRFMFLKPLYTNRAADRLNFNLNYDPRPNWVTFRRLHDLADLLLENLRPYGAKDYIDVQTFIYVTGRLEDGVYGLEGKGSHDGTKAGPASDV